MFYCSIVLLFFYSTVLLFYFSTCLLLFFSMYLLLTFLLSTSLLSTFLLSTFLLSTSLLSTVYYLLSTIYCVLFTVYYLLGTVNCEKVWSCLVWQRLDHLDIPNRQRDDRPLEQRNHNPNIESLADFPHQWLGWWKFGVTKVFVEQLPLRRVC